MAKVSQSKKSEPVKKDKKTAKEVAEPVKQTKPSKSTKKETKTDAPKKAIAKSSKTSPPIAIQSNGKGKGKGKKGKGKKEDDGKPKMPHARSPFFAYQKDVRESVAAANPSLKPKQLGPIMGGMWKSLSEEEKDKYKEVARNETKAVREAFIKEHPEFAQEAVAAATNGNEDSE